MGTKLANAPVYYTVAQVQFNPVLNLDAYIETIQSRMREIHYPDFKKDVFQRVDFPVMDFQHGQLQGVGQMVPTMTTESRYLFGDIFGRTIFLLERNGLTLQTTSYETFEKFSDSFVSVLKFLHETLRLDFVDRIGLRYLDAILPLTDEQPLDELLVQEVLGQSKLGLGQLQQSISETVVTTSEGILVSRVVIRNGQVGLPMELGGVPITIDPRFTQRNGLHAIVDTDASFAQRETVDIEKISSKLHGFHDAIYNSFKANVTDKAWAMWL